jgi:hypothetical protein
MTNLRNLLDLYYKDTNVYSKKHPSLGSGRGLGDSVIRSKHHHSDRATSGSTSVCFDIESRNEIIQAMGNLATCGKGIGTPKRKQLVNIMLNGLAKNPKMYSTKSLYHTCLQLYPDLKQRVVKRFEKAEKTFPTI